MPRWTIRLMAVKQVGDGKTEKHTDRQKERPLGKQQMDSQIDKQMGK